MRTKIHPLLITGIILALTTLVFSQTPRIVRWKESDANSKRIVRKEGVTKQLQVDGLDGITVTASIGDRPDSFSVELEINNQSQRNLGLRPQEIQFQMIRPWSKNLSFVPADVLARRLVDSAKKRADNIESRGSFATKTTTRTVVEHVPVITPTIGPSATDPTQIVIHHTPQIEVVHRMVTETVPDELERARSRMEASKIRSKAESERRQLLSTGLQTITITHNQKISGKSYYERERDIRELLLRIPLGDLIVEFPFSAFWQPVLLAPATIKFE